MQRMVLVVTALVMFVSVGACNKTATAPSGDAKVAATTAAAIKAPEGVVDAGNKTCPVMGGQVSGKDFVVYKGVRYNFCCPGCEKTFFEDPEKYIQKLKDMGEIK